MENTASSPNEKPIKQPFRSKMLTYFLIVVLPLTLIPIMIMGIVSYNLSNDLIISENTTALEGTTRMLGDTLTQWAIEKKNFLGTVTGEKTFSSNVDNLLKSSSSSSQYRAAREVIFGALLSPSPLTGKTYFDQALIVDSNGLVIASSDETWLGLSFENDLFYYLYIYQNLETSFLASPPNSLFTDNYSLLTSYPQMGSGNTVKAMVVGVSYQNSISNYLNQSRSTVPFSNAYLLTNTENLAGLTENNEGGLTTVEPSSNMKSNVIDPLVSNKENDFTTTNIDNTRSLYCYTWIDELNTGLVVELSNDMISDTLENIQITIIFVTILAAAMVTTGLVLTLKGVSEPIKAVAKALHDFTEGDLDQKVIIKRRDELGYLGSVFNRTAAKMGSQIRGFQRWMSEKSEQVEGSSEIARLGIQTTSMEELLDYTFRIIQERHNCYHLGVYLLNHNRDAARLIRAGGRVGNELQDRNINIQINPDSIIGWVGTHQRSYLIPNCKTDEETIYIRREELPNTFSEIAVPIFSGKEFLGVLDVHSDDLQHPFGSEEIGQFQSYANQLAAAILNFRMVEGSARELANNRILFKSSRNIFTAEREEDVIVAVNNILDEMPNPSVLYIAREFHFLRAGFHQDDEVVPSVFPDVLEMSASQADVFLNKDGATVFQNINDKKLNLHEGLRMIANVVGSSSAGIAPLRGEDGSIEMFIGVAAEGGEPLDESTMEVYNNLLDFMAIKLPTLEVIEEAHERVENLEALTQFSTAMSRNADFRNIFSMVHDEIRKFIGEVDFYIAFVDEDTNSIQFPYFIDEGLPISLAPIPVGDGLTSVVIRNRAPIRLVMDVETRARSMGANVTGQWAKSWMGIPMEQGGKVIGMFAMQDLVNEHRFSEADERLFTTLAPQITSYVSNAHQLLKFHQRTIQLQTASQIAREALETRTLGELLTSAINLIRERFNFYHASVFLPNDVGTHMEIAESTGEAGRQMKMQKHSLEIGSRSIVGQVSENHQPLVVNDVSRNPNHRPNPLLPDTKTELGIPLMAEGKLVGVLDVQSTQRFAFHNEDMDVLQSLANQLAIAIVNAERFKSTEEQMKQHEAVQQMLTSSFEEGSQIENLVSILHQQVKERLGEVDFFVAFHHEDTDHIEFPYVYEKGNVMTIPTIHNGEGLTSVIMRNAQPLILNENAETRAKSMGGRTTSGIWAKSWIGVPLTLNNRAFGVVSVQDPIRDSLFSDEDLEFMINLAEKNANVLFNALKQASREVYISQVAQVNEVLFNANKDIQHISPVEVLVKGLQEQFDLYHASFYVPKPDGSGMQIFYGAGESGEEMTAEGHSVSFDISSVIRTAVNELEHQIANDVNMQPNYRFNPLLPRTRSEAVFPVMFENKLLGALDFHASDRFVFDDSLIDALGMAARELGNILQNQDALETVQNYLNEYRLIRDIAQNNVSANNLDEALNRIVSQIQQDTGNATSILILDGENEILQVVSSAGYSSVIDGIEFNLNEGKGATVKAAVNKEVVIVADASLDSNFIQLDVEKPMRSEIAVPILYNQRLIGVLNLEHEKPEHFSTLDEEALTALASILSSIISTIRMRERYQTLMNATNNIRQSVGMEGIIKTTANELNKVLQTRRANVKIGVDDQNGKEGVE